MEIIIGPEPKDGEPITALRSLVVGPTKGTCRLEFKKGTGMGPARYIECRFCEVSLSSLMSCVLKKPREGEGNDTQE